MMKILRLTLTAVLFGLAFGSVASKAAEEPPTIINLPDDGAGAAMKKWDGIHGGRYIELFFVEGNRVTDDLRANVYNTTGLNGWSATNRDSAPEAVVKALDLKALAKDNGAFAVV